MLNDRPAQKPIVGELNHLEEMDVYLWPRELREFLNRAGELHAATLLNGHHTLEPWIRVRMDVDGAWLVAYGIEVTHDDDK